MKRVATVLVLLASMVAPAMAGRDWDDDDYYEFRHSRGAYRGDYGYGGPVYAAPPYPVYIPYYGSYFADEPDGYADSNCKIERKWKHGHYKEKIECDDD